MQYCMYTPPRSLLHDCPIVATPLLSRYFLAYNTLTWAADNLVLYFVFSEQQK